MGKKEPPAGGSYAKAGAAAIARHRAIADAVFRYSIIMSS
jgi:hypothetical protein